MRVIRKLFPCTDWFPIRADALRQDVIAGITVALVLIPQSMAYAQLAGLPAYYGLYAAFLPGIIGALWGSSHHLASGPTAVTSLLTATVLLPLALPGTPHYISLAIMMALMVGAARLVIGFLKLTWVANFISLPVIRGFTNAAAFIIAFSQLHKLLGISVERSDFFLRDIIQLLGGAGGTHLPTMIIGFSSLAVIFILRTFVPRVPFALLASAAAAGFVYLLRLDVEVVGPIPAGLPSFHVPPFNILSAVRLIPGTLLVLFISFMEVCSVTRAISAQSRQKVDLNQEMIGQGLAALGGSFFQSYPGGGSFSRTALTWSAGGKTSLAAIISGGMVLATLLFFTRYLYFLPQAALAAIIIISVIGLVDFRAVKEAWKVSAYDGFVSIVTFIATLLFAPNMVYGILAGVALSLVFHAVKLAQFKKTHHGLPADEAAVEDQPLRAPSLQLDPSFPIVRFSGRLYFARAPVFEECVLSLEAEYPNASSLIVSGEDISDMDATGEIMLRNLVIHLREGGIDLVFAGLIPSIRSLMKKTGLDEIIGEERFYSTVGKALEGERKRREAG